jgi:DNA-binding transcriptional MerR regulator
MKKQRKYLYKIGDVAVACGITRRAILHYESKGLVSPTEIHKASGYRYYSLEDVSNLLLILDLKASSLSLDDIAKYLNGKIAMENQIAKLKAQRDQIDHSIAALRSYQVKKDDYTVEWIDLPDRLCFVRSFVCKGVEEALTAGYETVDEAIRIGLRFSNSWSCFCEFPDNGYLNGVLNLNEFPMNACIPVEPESSTEGCVIYPAGQAIAVHHRGAYEDLGAAYLALRDYVQAHNLVPAKPVQEVYIEGPAKHKDMRDKYLTKVILPVEDHLTLSLRRKCL